MPEIPIEQRIENTVQHYLCRAGMSHDPSSPLPPLPDLDALIQEIRRAGTEQAREGFAFSADGCEWLRSVSRLIYAVLDDIHAGRSNDQTEKALIHAINCMDAFEEIQKTLRK